MTPRNAFILFGVALLAMGFVALGIIRNRIEATIIGAVLSIVVIAVSFGALS